MLAGTLGDIDSIVTSLLQAGSTLAGRLHVLRDRLSRERLQLAVLGQFKRGKRTFINALLGANLLPTGVIPPDCRRDIHFLAIRKRMMQKAGEGVVRSAENLRWAIVRGLDDLFRKATVQFEERLEEAMRTTRNVIAEALAQRQVQFFAVQPELERITIATGSLAKSCEQLQASPYPCAATRTESRHVIALSSHDAAQRGLDLPYCRMFR
jgi:hypothetical protein